MFRAFVTGVVQGVGFRPYICSAARNQGLRGYVQNVGTGVVILTNDKEKMISILKHTPELASIDSISWEESDETSEGFSIRESEGEGFAEIPPDLFMCDECSQDMNDESNRRFQYYFTTCTNCGPRYSMITKTPYDRPNTSMDSFPMCDVCKTEYTDETNRRYHAQTIACPSCGPKCVLRVGTQKQHVSSLQAIRAAAHHIRQGEVVAVKGVGGYHYMCNTDPNIVKKLRSITRRFNKPYAVMCKDIAMARSIAKITDDHVHLLQSPQRPIVLCEKTQELVGLTELSIVGIVLPYTGLHQLLFDALHEPIVCTSANRVDAPIITSDDALPTHIVLSHERKIVTAVDDSVVKLIDEKPLLLRRSRGYVPRSIPLPGKSISAIAFGGDLANTICLSKNGRAFLSEHIGNLSHPDTFNRMKAVAHKLMRFLDITPELVVCDKHPQYLSSQFARAFAKARNIPCVEVQHHLAHAHGVAAEHGFDRFTAIVCDGMGYGLDDTIWGGEVFNDNIRVGHLQQHVQLGGDQATLYPERMLLAILLQFLSVNEVSSYVSFSEQQLLLLEKQFSKQINSPLTSSCGRIIDAVAALLDLCKTRSYEGRPAMLLESIATNPIDIPPVISQNVLQTVPLFQWLIQNNHRSKGERAASVFLYLVKGLYKIARQFPGPIVFAGGCAYNEIMTRYLLSQGVYINKDVPPGDGGLSFGQLAFAAR